MKQFILSPCSSKLPISRFVTILLLLLGMVIFTQKAYSAQVTLTWGQITDPAVTGYKIHYGVTSGNYTQNIDVGNVTTYTIANLASGSTYYIAATDHDAAGNESGFSNEVVAVIPAGQQYTLSVGKAGTGTGTVTGQGINCGAACSGSYASGTDVILTATPASGSVFSGWSGGGGSGTGSYETIMNAATSVTATFTKVYSITATSDSNGTIIPSGNPPVSQATNGSSIIKVVTVNQGANQSFTITPNTGYHLATLMVDGASLGAVSTYTFSNVTADHTLNATFAINSYSISASAGTGGSVSPAGSSSVTSGASLTYTITPSTGYSKASVTVDGTSVGAVTSYTFSNVTANHTIAATFAAKTYTVTATTGTGGSVSPAGASTVSNGGSQTYTIAPATGYSIASVSVDGTSVGAVSSYTFSNVTANHTISATFALKTNTISASCGTGGSITPSGASTVNSGASQTYSIAPASGYQIAGVTVDGTADGAVSTYTFSNVAANHTIAATFVANTYSVTATTGTGGSISPAGISSVTIGSSLAYTITPATGYQIATVTVDGVSVGTVASYTFSNVSVNHTIAVTFMSNVQKIITAINCGGSIYTTSNGFTYKADIMYSGGYSNYVSDTIHNTTDMPIYQSWRYGTNFSYIIPLTNGNYILTLKFAENFATATGKRIFSIQAQGKTIISNLDIYAKVGNYKPYDVIIPVTVSNGTLNLNFISTVGNAIINGIVITTN